MFFFMMLYHQDKPFDQPQALLIFHLLQLQLYMLFYWAFPRFLPLSLSCCAHSYRQKLGDIARSPYLSLPLPCPQFTTTRSPEKTHHQLLRGVLRCVLDHRYGERELSRGANEKRPCAACHLRSACSEPVQLTGCGPSCSPPRKSNYASLLTESSFWKFLSLVFLFFFFFFFCYLCRRITVTNIKPNASRYARWSAAGIKLVEPFKRMTVEIFQGEGGGRLRRNRAALWGFTVNLKRI